jgi:P27 family predicted phage terminase small subunit
MNMAKKSHALPTPARGHPECPKHLRGEARKEWGRITDELDQMGLLTTADRPALALYCQTWARWIECEERVHKEGLLTPAPVTKTPMHNPYLSMANNAHAQIVKLLMEFGLTPNSRSKIKLEPKEESDKGFDLE